MIKVMRHIEIHLLESSKDVVDANQIGFAVEATETCEECFKSVGENPLNPSKFAPFCFVLDDEAEWVVCAECAEPIL